MNTSESDGASISAGSWMKRTHEWRPRTGRPTRAWRAQSVRQRQREHWAGWSVARLWAATRYQWRYGNAWDSWEWWHFANFSTEWPLSAYHRPGETAFWSPFSKKRVTFKSELLTHTFKIWEKVVDRRLRECTEIHESQFGFMPGRSTTDAIFIDNTKTQGRPEGHKSHLHRYRESLRSSTEGGDLEMHEGAHRTRKIC